MKKTSIIHTDTEDEESMTAIEGIRFEIYTPEEKEKVPKILPSKSNARRKCVARRNDARIARFAHASGTLTADGSAS